MTTKPDSRWEAAASREPYFSILTANKFRSANLTPAREREFFDSGEAFVESALRVIEARFIPQFTPASVLEYGCGVGRLAIPLARRAASVTAVDRSPTMLDLARVHAEQRGIENIDFQTPGELFATSRKFDLVTCYLLFQRMAQDDGLALLRQLLGRLGSRGIGVFHFQYRTTVPRFVAASRWLREHVPALNGVANVLGGKAFAEPFIANHTYDLDDIFRVLREVSIDAQYVIFERSEGLISALVFVEAPLSFTALGGRSQSPSIAEGRVGDATGDAPLIDVRQLVANTSIDCTESQG